MDTRALLRRPRLTYATDTEPESTPRKAVDFVVEGVDSAFTGSWIVFPTQKAASSNVAGRIHGNPHDAGHRVRPRLVAI